jgi:hypothetical protein
MRTRFACRIDIISYTKLLLIQNATGETRTEVLMRLASEGNLAADSSIFTLTKSVYFMLTVTERAELNVLARQHGIELAELVRRLLRS